MDKTKIFFTSIVLLLLATFIITLQRYVKTTELTKESVVQEKETDSEKLVVEKKQNDTTSIKDSDTTKSNKYIDEKNLLTLQRNALLIDLRNIISYKKAHIKNSIPIDRLPKDYDKSKLIILITDEKVPAKEINIAFLALSKESDVKIYTKGMRKFDEIGGNIIMKNDITNMADLSKVTFINLKEAKELTKSDKELTIVDVRRSGNFNESHLENAINIPYLDIESRYSELPVFSKKIFVYGANRKQSFLAGALLSDLGVFGVKTLDGGYEDLVNFKSEKDIKLDDLENKDTENINDTKND